MRAGFASGARFCAGPSNPSYGVGDNELPVQRALHRLLKPGRVFYDIGANVGFFSVIAGRLLGHSGWIYAFEPAPTNYAYLRYNLDLNRLDRVTCVDAAVAAQSGVESLILSEYSGGAALKSAPMPPDPSETIKVSTIALDDWVDAGFGSMPDVVKIDVEGAELGVLEGMTRILGSRRVSLVLELDAPEQREMDRRFTGCRDFLHRLGFVLRPLENSYPGSSWLVRHYVAQPG